jgi:uncharacterized protein with GYD domain
MAPFQENTMANYIALCNFTEQGVKTIKQTTQRAEAATALARKCGVTLKSVQWTLGAYDLVAEIEAPDDAALTAFELALAGQGNIRTQTMRAFSRDEMNAVLAKVPG